MNEANSARAGKYLGSDIGDRQVSELVGVARGLIADGHLNDAEIEFLHKWLVGNDAAQSNPVLGILFDRIREIYADGYVDEDERSNLTDVLHQFAANDFELGELLTPTALPITDPAPNLDFDGRRFCFTGTFAYGRRAACEAIVAQYGAICAPNLTRQTDYLIIGQYATAAWKQSSFGRKIEHAVELRASGIPIAIIAEHHWRNYI